MECDGDLVGWLAGWLLRSSIWDLAWLWEEKSFHNEAQNTAESQLVDRKQVTGCLLVSSASFCKKNVHRLHERMLKPARPLPSSAVCKLYRSESKSRRWASDPKVGSFSLGKRERAKKMENKLVTSCFASAIGDPIISSRFIPHKAYLFSFAFKAFSSSSQVVQNLYSVLQ